MFDELRRVVGRIAERLKRRFWGPTFRCPVCHFVLAAVDADGNGLLVCPVCGAVIEIEAVYGHIVPVVHDMEIFRPQPKARLHPLATHLPIGLFPFALLGAGALFLASALRDLGVSAGAVRLAAAAPLVADGTLVLLVTSVVAALATLATGLWDWFVRYRRRPYRQITLKIVGSIAFLGLGAVAIALHASGLVFPAGAGLMALSTPLGFVAAALYLGVLAADMVVLATLGHVGGTLVFGR